ncbi:MAG: FAD-binding oxidoreductase [Xenococcaceae cyanobacterium MO_188.B29]|nr:FAD-binding oxidoreductase [Xenococcaceae cyanobacterium MO_188.B29]
MVNYDWIVIGGGITGSALAYELSQQQFKVLLIEKNTIADNATVYSYGGLAYWSGTDELTSQLCQEGIELHRNLTKELESNTEFRELDLVLTIDKEDNPQTIAQNYDRFAIKPELLDIQQVCQLEPLLNPNAIAGALKLPHGHIHPQKTNDAYQQAFLHQGGEIIFAEVVDFVREGELIQGVKTDKNNYYAANTVVCAGGLTLSLLLETGTTIPNYFTHAQVIKTPPVDITLNALVMPAVQKRFGLETAIDNWDTESSEPITSIIDAGAIQFLDGSFCLGQISAIIPNPRTKLDQKTGEKLIRQEITKILPDLGGIPGTCHCCLVAFNPDNIALVGKLAHMSGMYIFSGFTSTLVFAPPLARRFAKWAANGEDAIIAQLSSQLNPK